MSTDLPACVGLLGLLAQASTLKRLPRTGWLLAGVLPCETVADHTAGVALLTLGLAAAINQDWRAVGLEQPLDSGVAVTIAVLHDLAESQVTDLPRRSARLIGAAVKRQAEAAALVEILQPLPGGAAYVALWQE
jgi:putative hydrolase of HD superfamily